jgi:hypothetical protein
MAARAGGSCDLLWPRDLQPFPAPGHGGFTIPRPYATSRKPTTSKWPSSTAAASRPLRAAACAARLPREPSPPRGVCAGEAGVGGERGPPGPQWRPRPRRPDLGPAVRPTTMSARDHLRKPCPPPALAAAPRGFAARRVRSGARRGSHHGRAAGGPLDAARRAGVRPAVWPWGPPTSPVLPPEHSAGTGQALQEALARLGASGHPNGRPAPRRGAAGGAAGGATGRAAPGRGGSAPWRRYHCPKPETATHTPSTAPSRRRPPPIARPARRPSKRGPRAP